MTEDWNDNYQEQLRLLGITCLYHITDRDNFISILMDGYLSSWARHLKTALRCPTLAGMLCHIV